MQTPCSPLDASQLLRDILQSKEHQYNDNNANSGSIKDVYASDCSSAISPILNSKSSDMAFNDRDNTNDIENDNENDGDIDVATDNNSCANDDDHSDDLDDRSLDASVQGSKLNTIDNENNIGESKEAKRAHVEVILTSMKQSPPRDSRDSSVGVLGGDFKRQKRKQPQPQQHESSALESEELSLRRQIQQLQEQMQAVKRKREEDMSASYNDDDAVIDDDLTDDEGSKPPSPLGGEMKRVRMEHMISGIRSSSPMDNGLDFANRTSPGGDSNKKQKRKQAQPQQHENNRSEHREGGSSAKHNENTHRFSSKIDDDSTHIEDELAENNNPTALYGTDAFFRNSLYRSLGHKDLIPPFQNGFDHHFYKEHFLRQNIFGMRPDLDATAVFRSKALQIRTEPGKPLEVKTPQTDVSQIANALKAELTQAVNKAIDIAVIKVLSEKQTVQSSQPPVAAETTSQQQSQDRQIQQQPDQQQQQQLKLLHSPNVFPHFLHQHHQQQQHFQQQQQQQQHRLHHHHNNQQQQQQQQNTQSSQISEREAHKETLNNAQPEKKPELIVPFSDHLHFLERFGNRLHHEKMSAFDPLHKSENELITPHTGPSISFHPHFPYYLPSQVLPPMYTGEPEQTEALPLLVNTPKKKRTKVTDTRLSPRGKPSCIQDNVPMDHAEAQRHMAAVTFPHFLPPVLPTSVAITNPSLTHSELLAIRLQEASFRDSRIPSPKDQSRGSPRSPSDSPHYMNGLDMFERGSMSMAGDLLEGSSPGGGLLTSTLTPMHLRKAKLMFFYTRYPSSSILKMYFPDVMFNKNNTAQLVKWFSNFREFFYIQMEKYARQALAEGCKHSDDLIVSADSELFRHLNLHYNRNNQLEVPHNFLSAVQAALKEFFKAIQSNKDAEPSWKKAIYKIIARMDETLPDFFKSPNWIEQLGDQ